MQPFALVLLRGACSCDALSLVFHPMRTSTWVAAWFGSTRTAIITKKLEMVGEHRGQLGKVLVDQDQLEGPSRA